MSHSDRGKRDLTHEGNGGKHNAPDESRCRQAGLAGRCATVEDRLDAV